MKRIFVLLTMAGVLAAPSQAETILAVGDAVGSPGGCIVIWAGQGYRVGWTQADNYGAVSVAATLSSGGAAGQTGRAYLTTQIGPGTTATNEVASTSFSFPLEPTNVVLFQNLSLPAGAYYLSIIGDSQSWGSCWNSFIATNATTAPDVTCLGCFGTGGTISDYFPASPVYADNPVPPGIDVEGMDLNHPRLEITQTGGVVLISWSTNSVGFVLQSTQDFSTSNWQAVAQQPVIFGNSYVFAGTPNGSQFYRLVKTAN